MKIREILVGKEQGLQADTGAVAADLLQDLPGQVRSLRSPGNPEPLSGPVITKTAPEPVDGSGTEASLQVGRVPMRVPPQWEIDRIRDQVKRLPRHHQLPRR
jgi:hypothetical protein